MRQCNGSPCFHTTRPALARLVGCSARRMAAQVAADSSSRYCSSGYWIPILFLSLFRSKELDPLTPFIREGRSPMTAAVRLSMLGAPRPAALPPVRLEGKSGLGQK